MNWALNIFGQAINPCGYEASFKSSEEGENHTFKVVWATRLRRISLFPFPFFLTLAGCQTLKVFFKQIKEEWSLSIVQEGQKPHSEYVYV